MYLFLDIDGVLNTMRSSDLWERGPDGIPSSFIFDPEAVSRINVFLNSFCPDIVIHSSWKERMELPEMQRVFAYNGVVSSPFSFTPVAETKGEGILRWLSENGGIEDQPYLVVDDVATDIEQDVPDDFFIHVMNGWLKGFGDRELRMALERMEEWTSIADATFIR